MPVKYVGHKICNTSSRFGTTAPREVWNSVQPPETVIATNTAARPHAIWHNIGLLVCDGVSVVLRAASSPVSLIAVAWTLGFVVEIMFLIWIFGPI